jgi:hypothetical protein
VFVVSGSRTSCSRGGGNSSSSTPSSSTATERPEVADVGTSHLRASPQPRGRPRRPAPTRRPGAAASECGGNGRRRSGTVARYRERPAAHLVLGMVPMAGNRLHVPAVIGDGGCRP